MKALGILLVTLLCAPVSIPGAQPLTAGQSIDRAIESSPVLREALVKLGLGVWDKAALIRTFYPTLSLSYSSMDSVATGSPDTRTRRLALGLSHLLYDGGKRADEIEALEEQRLLATLDFEGLRQDIAVSVVTAYVRLQALSQSEEIQEQAFRISQDQTTIARKELALGFVTELDMVDMELELRNLELELEKTRQTRRTELFEFRRLLGLGDTEDLRLVDRINEAYRGFLRELPPEAWLDKRLARERDSVARRLEISRAARALERARSWHLPDLTARFELSFSGQRFPLNQPGFSVSLELGLPIPTSPVRSSISIGSRSPRERSRSASVSVEPLASVKDLKAVPQAALALETALRSYDEFAVIALQEIRDTLQTLAHKRRVLDLLADRLRSLEARHRILAKRLALGEIKRLDYIEQEIELARSRAAFLSEVAALYSAEVAHLRSVGEPVTGTYVGVLITESS